MGCFDTVRASCPKCNVADEVQTKAGACTLRTYNVLRIPQSYKGNAAIAIAAAAADELFRCESCGTNFKIDVSVSAVTVLAEED